MRAFRRWQRNAVLASGLALVAAASPTFGQQAEKTWRVGFLATSGPEGAESLVKAFRGHMRELGYVEGKNLTIDVRSLETDPSVAAALAGSNVDVIVAWATPASIAAQRATATIPIVFVGNSDPIGSGLVQSLARPGGNITGVSNIGVDLAAKQAQLVVELLPGTKRVGVIYNKQNPAVVTQFGEVTRAIRALGLQSDVVDARTGKGFDEAFRRFGRNRVDAVLLIPDPSLLEHRNRIASLALKVRLPTVFQREESVRAGGLISYGPNLTDQLRQVARLVDRILKGARPADLPVEQPERVEMVLNAKTARALGIAIPASVEMRAQVIE